MAKRDPIPGAVSPEELEALFDALPGGGGGAEDEANVLDNKGENFIWVSSSKPNIIRKILLRCPGAIMQIMTDKDEKDIIRNVRLRVHRKAFRGLDKAFKLYWPGDAEVEEEVEEVEETTNEEEE